MTADFKSVTSEWDQYVREDILESILKFESMLTSNQDMQNCISNALLKQNRLLKEINDKGGIIVTGTDPILPMITPGYSLHRKMELVVDAGLSGMEAIQTATFNAAKALRKDPEFGSLEVGKLANMVVVQGDPSQNISDIGNTIMIFKHGTRYDPDELRESVLGKIGKKDTE